MASSNFIFRDEEENRGAGITAAKNVLQTPAKEAFKDVTNRENLGANQECEASRWNLVKKLVKDNKVTTDSPPVIVPPAFDHYETFNEYADCSKHPCEFIK